MKKSALLSRAAALLFGFACAGSGRVVAGPPFQTDDPEPIDFRHYEFYTFTMSDGTPVETDPATGLEFNWGALPNVHLHVIIPIATILPSNDPRYAPAGIGPSTSGLGDIEAGIKYRFVQENKHRPMIGTFVMFELPSGSAARGLGVGKTWYKVPLWVQKSFGPWTTYGGGGETIFSSSPGYRNYPFAGWLVQRDIGKKVTLGSEVFYHGPEGLATPQTRHATMLDAGGYYKFRDPGFQLLFCYGHTIAGQNETYAYLGLYWTWGKTPGAPDKDSGNAMNFAPPGALSPGGPGGL